MTVRGYLSAIPTAVRKEAEDRAYRLYVTEALKAITQNTSQAVIQGAGVVDYGTRLTKSWHEIIDFDSQEKQEEPEDTRSCREVTDDIWRRIRGGK